MTGCSPRILIELFFSFQKKGETQEKRKAETRDLPFRVQRQDSSLLCSQEVFRCFTCASCSPTHPRMTSASSCVCAVCSHAPPQLSPPPHVIVDPEYYTWCDGWHSFWSWVCVCVCVCYLFESSWLMWSVRLFWVSHLTELFYLEAKIFTILVFCV